MPKGGSFSARLALASGPLLALLACSVYEAPLGGASGAGGTEAGSGVGGSSNGGGSTSGSDAGGSSSGAGVGGSAIGGNHSAGDSGSAGTDAGGTSHGGSETAGSDAGGQPTGEDVLVDNMEDTNAQIDIAAGRNGFWYVGNDTTVGGTQEPPSTAFAMFELTPGENGDSTYSAHMKVSGWTGWGTVIGFNLVESGGVKPWDASAYCGVSFSGKAMAATALRFRMPDGDTHPAGGVCMETGAANQLCYDHFSAPVTLTAAWKPFTVMFTELTQS